MKQPHHTGHHGSNVITGTGRADTIFGGHGTADIHGWAGDDVLHAATRGGSVSGGHGNDIIYTYGFGAERPQQFQTHAFGDWGDDTIYMDTSRHPDDAYGLRFGHHVFGGHGRDKFVFQNVGVNDQKIIGRIDDFDASSDTLWLDDVKIDLSAPPENVRIISYKGQQWILINERILYSLEGARHESPTVRGDGRNAEGLEEDHFIDWPKEWSGRVPVSANISYKDPVNFVPRHLLNIKLEFDNQFSPTAHVFVGTAGSDRIDGCPHHSQALNGGAGDDFIWGNRGNDTIHGDSGNDYLDGYHGHDVIFGGQGNDTIDGGKGHDLIFGGDGNDVIAGGSDNDTIHGGAGNDTIYGGSEDDLIFGNNGRDVLYGGPGNDTIRGGNGADLIHGDRGNDVLYGGSHNDTIYGGDGNDTLSGGDGNDLVYGGPGNDLIAGDAGNDILHGGSGKDSIYGGLGNDRIFGNLGDDYIHGGLGNDTINGGPGDDRIYGNAGDDWLRGGLGNDTMDGGPGSDWITFMGEARAARVDLAITGPQDTGHGRDVIQNIENIHGGAGDDALWGNADRNTIRGGAGADRIFGRGGDDILEGNGGSDLLNGGPGNDTLIGGTGNDLLIGGSGADTFVFRKGFDHDTIVDFEDNVDTIRIANFGFSDFSDVRPYATQVGSHVVLDFGDGDRLTIQNTTIGAISDDFVFI